jgi:mRNA-degrading endonuclease RelE of RelBE toxin-antitoxin system
LSFTPKRRRNKAEKKAKDLLRKNPELIPEFQEYRRILSEEPYKFPKKKGKLKSCRALNFTVKDNTWRLIFRIIEVRNTAEILAIGLHDDGYNSAERRI